MITITLHAVESRDVEIVLDDDRMLGNVNIKASISKEFMESLRTILGQVAPGKDVCPESTWIHK